MRILIIENELYLAQSISMSLSDAGHHCQTANSFASLAGGREFDVVLVSTSTENFLAAVEHFREAIIILLVSYISADTVSLPLERGAMDYIQKPFMLEELGRKIEHYFAFKKISRLKKSYEDYVRARFAPLRLPALNFKRLRLPLVIKTANQNLADAFLFRYALESDLAFSYLDLAAGTEELGKMSEEGLLFLANFQVLRPSERERILDLAQEKRVLIHSAVEIEGLINIDLNTNQKELGSSEILSIDEYVRQSIITYQNIFSDTDLSKKLGISRKSLWERRKKYELSKKR